ncbi:alpha-1,6-mannosyl-glycoprotein 2-beta-N-acetylglucosaminyltransferase-like [Littorina saxatilis]|uniref:Alpha-1,6-mannosyl-glycoprotein 2-beta-N-acetylglucosaminyltransferase n=1 Tax=Littorina saxatilis TaxID=31220 RepID=A0AAN9BT76_9CAEN
MFRMRLHPRRALRIVLVVSMVLFVILNFQMIPDSSEEQRLRNHHMVAGGGLAVEDMHVQLGNSQRNARHGDDHKSDADFRVSLSRPVHPKIVIAAGSNQTQPASLQGPSLTLNTSNLEEIKQEIQRLNKEQYVHNLDKFGLALGSESIVMVIQAHNRADHLKLLISSLSKVRGIDNVLLVVSHDVYSHELNELIGSITFCPVLQIFFPHSQQIYHNRFPGEDPNDCPRDIKKDQAVLKQCNNAGHPDKYGHYRESKYCQTKHHWIWKLRFVFEEVRLLEGYEGHVLLLEDDYYVSEDILFSLQMMQNVRNKDCADCRMLVLGNYDKSQNYKVNGGKVERAYWISSKHNMGMAFTRNLWTEIKKCGKEFCDHDDYNWDWTLQHLSMKCVPNKIRLLKMKATRVFHIGECGMHTKSKNCDPAAKVRQVETQLTQNRQYLFPNTVAVDGDSRFKLRDPKANGGWGDNRDRNMCHSFFNKSIPPFLR